MFADFGKFFAQIFFLYTLFYILFNKHKSPRFLKKKTGAFMVGAVIGRPPQNIW